VSLNERLEALLEKGRDGAPLRVSLALACLGRGDAADALAHVERAIELDSGYTAAWKAYGRALAMSGRDEEAARAWERGIECARAAGDRQAEKEMQVFLKRARKARQP
jgi:Tfp pilus assembly protein PilF